MSFQPLQSKRIILGITGSIACYKSADLASKLAQQGADVDVILTRGAQQFITPLTFQSVTGRRAYTDDDLWGNTAHVLHVGLAHAADLLVIAPATANTIAQLATGMADNLLGITALAAECPIMLAPAMDGGMFTHPATQTNLATLTTRGGTIIGPEEGHLASGLVAKGRMTEPLVLLGHIRHLLARGGPLRGRKVVVTAGGTREPVDPVRVLTNRSSGKQGLALSQAALDAGGGVVLITTMDQPVPVGVTRIDVETAEQMKEAVLRECTEADVLVMAAAVADFRPAQAAPQKIKKQQGLPTIELARNPDILLAIKEQRSHTEYPRIVVGFAAETENLLENAQSKLDAKGLDLIVANNVSAQDAGFAVETNRVTLLLQGQEPQTLPLMRKDEVATQVIERVIELLSRLT